MCVCVCVCACVCVFMPHQANYCFKHYLMSAEGHTLNCPIASHTDVDHALSVRVEKGTNVILQVLGMQCMKALTASSRSHDNHVISSHVTIM